MKKMRTEFFKMTLISVIYLFVLTSVLLVLKYFSPQFLKVDIEGLSTVLFYTALLSFLFVNYYFKKQVEQIKLLRDNNLKEKMKSNYKCQILLLTIYGILFFRFLFSTRSLDLVLALMPLIQVVSMSLRTLGEINDQN